MTGDQRLGRTTETFFGWRVTWAAFIVAVFGWGLGFYGPPVYLYAVQEARGWSLELVSTAVTAHYLIGAVFVANLPALHRRFGLPNVTKAGAASLAVGLLGWALAQAPSQLFVATILSGAGWAATGPAAINAMVSPWFQRRRPAALSFAYNGASVGGIVFSPLLVAAIAALGFPGAAAAIGLVLVATLWFLSRRYFARTPEQMGLAPDGDAAGPAVVNPVTAAKPLPGRQLWRDWRFITLASGMTIGLFAQVGVIAHLFSLLVPALGAQLSGVAAGFATFCAIAGRTLVGWLLPRGADRRVVAAANYAVQTGGCAAFLLAGDTDIMLMLLGVLLIGAGIGNTTSLPPLIAQVEFAKVDVPRAVALITATSQATYAFAPAAFGVLRAASDAPLLFAAAIAVQLVAAGCYLSGRTSTA
ncbi:MAG TPA: MFS transporter [Alphaproteobacteria bacterium]|nr:MFS transporter [Alphaproteobacteria bacterium]